MAMSAAQLGVLAIDRDPVRAWMAKTNAGCEACVAEAAMLTTQGSVVHLDPHRRSVRGRSWRLEDYQPGPDDIRRLIRDAHASAVKLGPGVDLNACRTLFDGPCEIELISLAGRLNQAVLWTGTLVRSLRSATHVEHDGSVHTLADDGASHGLPLSGLDRFVFTVDPAVERAGLMPALAHRVGAAAPHAQLGLLTSDRVIESAWLTAFEVMEQMPWRVNKVKAWLAAHNGGIVEVKTRGGVVDTDRAQAQLRGEGDHSFTVFVLRFDQRVVAAVTRRVGVCKDEPSEGPG